MHKAFLLSIATSLLATAAVAAESEENCAKQWLTGPNRPMEFADFMDMCVGDYYRNDHLNRTDWKLPAVPVDVYVTGRCKDGTWTRKPTRQDACITNGGVDTWYRR